MSKRTIKINGETYIHEDDATQSKPNGPLTMLVLHRGFIFVGEWDGATLSNASNVRRWDNKVGVGGLTQGAKYAAATLDKCQPVTPEASAILYHSRLPEGWAEA